MLVEVEIGDQLNRYYRFEKGGKLVGFYDKDGKHLAGGQSLMRKPIQTGRVSSGYGYRQHPILKKRKLHTGVDYAAKAGTPIFAAGDGKIIERKYSSSWGNTIEIRHDSNYRTRYAHMRAFNKNAKLGSYVKKGQVIGYVGSTGRSTGPHLHYEVKKNGKTVNPVTAEITRERKLTGAELKEFRSQRNQYDQLLDSEGQLAGLR